jgi:3-oxoacyl-[acyl-carrier-protein] synthase-3
MALLSFEHVGILGMGACVPANTIRNREYTLHFSAAEAIDIVEKTGIEERRFATEGMCSSDLCFAAAEKLIEELGICKDDIGLLVFISQTPDYRMPATAVILQHRLGLPKSTMALDISLGCSAFVYGLSIVYSLVEKGTIQYALLLDGETRSRVYHPKDRRVGFLFGDGGVAAIISKDTKFGQSFFSLNSDGSREDLIKIKAGGYRFPSTPATLAERVVDEYGNISTDEHGTMNGGDVFNFVLAEIPPNFKDILAYAAKQKEDIDYFVFHQANNFMNGYLQKKLKLPDEKVPSSISKFGNTSSVSIPITIVSELKNKLHGSHTLLLSGFGVGMSWASAVLPFHDCHLTDIVEI